MNLKSILLIACRLVTASVFIFSGFVKSVDPWGTALKVGEYLAAAGITVSDEVSLLLSVLLCGGELLLGLALLIGVRRRESSFLLMVAMVFFTATTLWIAATNPVADCGCFGDALKLTNWQTFFKNLVLLPMSIFIFAVDRRERVGWNSLNIGALGVLAVMSFGVSAYSLCRLPIIDFLPYQVGVNVIDPHRNVTEDSEPSEGKTTLIYRDRQSGDMHEFSLEDTQWQDTTRWEFVDTVIEDDFSTDDAVNAVSEFALFSNGEFNTRQLLEQRNVLMVCIWDSSWALSPSCMEWLENEIEDARAMGYDPICVSPTPADDSWLFRLGDHTLPYYNVDAKTLKMLLRSRIGIVMISDGVIVAKDTHCHCAF